MAAHESYWKELSQICLSLFISVASTHPTIFCSQYLEEDWYQKLGGKDNPLTDAIMDRISFDSYKIPIMSLDPEKDISMREVYGLDPSQAQ